MLYPGQTLASPKEKARPIFLNVFRPGTLMNETMFRRQEWPGLTQEWDGSLAPGSPGFWDVVRAGLLAGSLEALVFDRVVDVGDVNAAESATLLQEIPRQYVIQDTTIVLDDLFLCVCVVVSHLSFERSNRPFQKSNISVVFSRHNTLGSLSSIVYVAPSPRHR